MHLMILLQMVLTEPFLFLNVQILDVQPRMMGLLALLAALVGRALLQEMPLLQAIVAVIVVLEDGNLSLMEQSPERLAGI